MLFSFLIAAVAGYVTPMAEPHVGKFLKQILLEDLPFSEGEFRTFTFVVVMLVAAAIAGVITHGAPAFLMLLGGGLGLFGTRIFAALRKRMQ